MAQVISLTSVQPECDPKSSHTTTTPSTPIPIPSTSKHRLVDSKRQFFENQIRANSQSTLTTPLSQSATATTMGQNTSQELLPNVPYHEKHYIENNKQLQRQSSLNQLQRQNSLSSNNLLLSREPSLKRADSISGGSISGGGGGAGGDGRGGVGGLLQHGANRSMASLKSTPTHGGTDSNGAGTERTSSSFIRLLPIETETPYYDDDSEEEDEEEGSEEDFKEEEGEEGMLVDGHAGLHAARGDVTTVSGHNSQQTSPRHLVQKRHPHPRRHSKEDDNHDRQRLSLSSSPSDFDKAMNANSRLSRSDSLENYYHQREVLDDEQTRAEEAEDLVFLSPAQGHSFDSISSSSTSSNSQRHPSMTMTTPRSIPIPTTTTTSTNTFTSSSSASLSRSGSGSGVIRYQLHDEPVRKNLESSRAEGGLRRGVDYEEYSEDEDEDDQEEEERQRRRRGEGQDTEGVEQDEEDREDHFLRRHYASLGMNYIGESDGGGGGGGSAGAAHPPHPRGPHRQYRPVHLQNDEYSDSDDSDDSDEDVLVLDEDDEDDEDEYREVEMNQLLMEDTNQPHDIQLLSGSLSVRSPFLDSIQEEEEEEGESAFPPRAIASARLSSSVPTLSSMFMASASSTSLKNLHRLTPDLDHNSNGSNNNNNSSSLYHHQQGRSPAQPTQPTAQGNQRTGTSPTALQPVLSERPRGPRPPIMMGRPRSNSSLTRLLESDHEASHPQDGSYSQKEDTTTRPNSSMSDTVQDLEVKRVMEGHPAVADLATLAPSSSRMMNTAVTAATTTTVAAGAVAASTTTTATATSTAAAVTATATADSGTGSRPTSVPNPSKEGAEVRPPSSTRQTPTASFGQDTQRSMDEFFGAVKHDLEERIQQAIQGVEQKFLDRVHRLEERNALLAAAAEMAAQNDGQPASNGEEGQEGSWMASLAKPLPLDQNPGGSVALRKEILNHVTEKVGDLDLRVNQMEVLVSYKLVDIESKVQDLHGAHNSIVQKVHQVAKTQSTKMTDTEAGDGLGADSIKVGEAKLETAMQPYRLAHANENNRDRDHDNGSDEDANSKALVSPRAVLELRQEVAALGTQYRDLNEGLLTDLLSQMRDAKLMLLQTVDEVDNRISKRVDRIEAEMHARLLTEIEGRVQERVRAMEQTLSRLEHCFDKTNGRLGALETTLASKQRPGRLDYQQQHQNHALQYHAGGAYRHYETIAGDGTTSSSSYHRSVTSLIFSDMDLAAEASNTATTSVMHDRPVSAPARPPLIHSDSSSPESPLPSGQEGSSKQHQHQHQQASNRAAWSSSSTTPMPTTPSEEIAHLVASPLERGTVIGGKHATIHAHDDGIHLGNGGNNRPMVGSLLTPLASSPMPSSGSKGEPVVAPVPSTMPAVGGVGGRRVSMPSLDTKSATMRDVAGGASSARGLGARTPRDLQVGTGYSTVATTTATGTARRPMKRAMSMDTNGSVGPMVGGGGGVGGSLTIRPSQVVGSGSFPALVSPTGSSSSNSSGASNTLKSPTSATSGTDLKQRLLGHGQGTKAGVKNPPSYRELLHFWKAGGSTPDLLKGV